MKREPKQTAHARRIEDVIGHICAHLDDALTLDHLIEVAEFVRLTRLERASYQLAFDPQRSVLQVALDAGFSAPEAFARAFKELRGQTPSEFRRCPRWQAWASGTRPQTPIRSNPMKPDIVV